MSSTNDKIKHLSLKDSQDLDRQISNKLREIKELDSYVRNVEYTLKERIQQMAELLEEKMQRAGNPEFIYTISGTIIRMFREQGLAHRSDSVLLALPQRYKDLHKSSSHLTESSDKPTEESTITFNQIKAYFKHFLSREVDLLQFTKRQLQDIASDIDDAQDKITEYCNENAVKTVSTGESYSWVDGLNQNKPPAVTLAKAPDAITSPRDDAKEWFRLSDLADKMGKARLDYPWKDLKDVHAEANAVRAFNNLLEPCVNRKYRYDPRQYNDMMYEAVSQSGTAAASHSGVICATTINPKTGLPELRKITKEQLDAICLPFYNKMNQVLAYAPTITSMIKKAYDHFEGYDATYLAERAKEVGPKLQKIK